MNYVRQKSSELIRQAIRKSLIPRNQIATISGLTNTYIRDLEQGNIANISREKLISFATAVNLTLEETDELLTACDRSKLTSEDIPLFINTAKQRRASNVINVARDFFGYELLLLAAESIPGPKSLCTYHPTVILQPAGLRSYYLNLKKALHPIHLMLKEAIGLKRKQNLTLQLTQYPMHHYIYVNSLENYILDCENKLERSWRIKHMEEVIKYIQNYENFNFYITRHQSGFNFLLKYEEQVNSASSMFYYTHDLGVMQGRLEGQIIGFFTGNKLIIEQFEKDLEILSSTVLEEYLDRDKLVKYLNGLIAKAKKMH